MSKSALEQFQIKKKRKHNNHHNRGISKTYHNAAALDKCDRFVQFSPILLDEKRNYQYKYNLALSPESIICGAADEIDNDNYKEDTSTTDCLRRDTSRHVLSSSNAKMPLSQGFYAKGALSTKRGIKAIDMCGRTGVEDAKTRRLSENVQANTNNISCRDNQNMKNMHPFLSNSHHQYMMSPTPSIRKQQQQQQPQQHRAHQQQSLNRHPNGNNLQLSYLLGESLARYGRLHEAFDVYAIIASEHLDGFISLDRLNTLATCLISSVRQLSNTTIDVTSQAQATDTADMTLNSKFATWDIASATTPTMFASAAPNSASSGGVGNAIEANSKMDLRVPSPSDDYDPLLCPLCRDILRCPVTTNCGHTFCRQCCETITMCNICQIKFPKSSLDEFVAMDATTPTAATTATGATTMNIVKNYINENVYNLSNTIGISSNLTATASSLSSPSPSTSTLTSTMLAMPPISASISLLPSTFDATTTGDNSQQQQFNDNFPSSAVSSAIRLRRHIASSPTITMTTTTVASTTATATTTMASSSSATATAAVVSADNMKFMPDVLVRKLVEKWWGADLQAKKINETAASYMHLNLLDDALKFCNASLEKSSTNFKSLLLRAEVLRKLNHFQSSLADVENALRNRYTSPKAHYLRALALCDLGRFDEALYDNCLAISLDKTKNLTSSELFQHDLTKNLQKLLAQSPKKKTNNSHRTFRTTGAAAPYFILSEHRLRRKQIALLSNASRDYLTPFDVDVDVDAMVDVEEDDDDDDGGAHGDGYGTCGKQYHIMADDEDILLDTGDIAMDYVRRRHDAYAGIVSKDYQLALRRQTSRKHFRRKWMAKETELLPAVTLHEAHCSTLFRSVLDRIQQEVHHLKKMEVSGESPNKQLTKVPASLIDASDFDCVLCCRTLWKPVVTPCGHTYCWVCLDRCMDYTSSCPLCMSPLVEPNVNMYQGSSSPVPFILAKRPITKFLEAAMKRFIPDSYEKRFRQEMEMEPSVPVFICTTAFPYVPCPLFVYEPRYRLMVRRAVESGEKQFGIVQPHSGKSRYFDVGTILDIRDCVLLGDGCSILSTIGCKRFKILARNEKDGYETAKVEYIYDETISAENVPFVSNMHATVLTKAMEWFESLSTELKQEILQSFGEMPPVEDNWETIADGPAWAWWIIALLPLSQQLKVDILATTSLEKRLRAIEKTLDYMSGTFRRSQQNCGVVIVQQQQQQHQQHEQQQQCDTNVEHIRAVGATAAVATVSTDTCQIAATVGSVAGATADVADTTECCQRTTTSTTNTSAAAAAVAAAATAATSATNTILLTTDVGSFVDVERSIEAMDTATTGTTRQQQLML